MQRRYRSGKFRRVFSRFGLFSLLILASSPVTAPDVQSARLKERRAEVTYSVNLNAPAEAKHVRLWIPYPMSDENQEITDVVVTGNSTSWGVYKEGAFGNAALYAEWKNTKGPRTLTYTLWYSPGYGWVVVDPADVRKAILEKKISLEKAKPLREYYFGAVDESRIAIGTGRNLVLNPPQSGEPLNYFMYPYAEADGIPLNEDLFGFNLGYEITFRELRGAYDETGISRDGRECGK